MGVARGTEGRDAPRSGHGLRPARSVHGVELTQATEQVVADQHHRVHRPARQARSHRLSLPRRIAEEPGRVSHRGDLGPLMRQRHHRVGIVGSRADRVAPGDERRRTLGGSGEPLELAARGQLIPDASAAAEVIARRGQHDLRAGERRRPGRPFGREGTQPALGDAEVQPLGHLDDRVLRGGPRLAERARAQELLGRLLVMALPQQQAAVGDAQRVQLVGVAAFQAREQVLAEARMAAHHAPVRAPADRQVQGAKASQPLAGVGQPECSRPRGTDLVEQRRRHQEVTVARIQLVEDVRGEIAVQGVRLAAHAGDVVRRPPRLEQDPGHPAARRLHRRAGIDVPLAEVGQRVGRLRGREREVGLAECRNACTRRQLAERWRDLPPAQEQDPHRRRRVAEERLDDGPRVAALPEPLELVEDEDQRCVCDRFGEQTRRLPVRDPGRQRPPGDAVELRQRLRQSGLEVRDEPAGRRVRAIDRQPGDADGPAPARSRQRPSTSPLPRSRTRRRRDEPRAVP